MVIVLWIIFAFIVANAGDSRKIGFGTALVLSLILSPVVGLIMVMLSDRKNPQEVVVKNTTTSTADELTKLADLRDRNIISNDDFEKQKAKILK